LMEMVPCNLCGSRDHEVVYRQPDAQFHPDEWFDVVACRACGLGFVNPRPTPAEMQRYYPPRFFDYFEHQRAFHERRYAREATLVGEPPSPSRRLLDVGCANGDFPRYMQSRGWEVEGVEVSESARDIDDFPVHRDEFPRLALEPDSYDAVTAWAVLEHVHDPMSYFRQARTVLTQGGVFVFLVTNFESLASRRLFQEDVPRHLYFFTASCVRRYLEKVGLTIERVDYSDRIYGMDPRNWLVYHLHRLRGARFDWHRAQNSRDEYFRQNKMPPTLLNKGRFLLHHPIVALDRATTPLYARWEMLRRRYGIVTVRARKPR
jgi:2-polyprenyl-3-methyl-5-hydroxy-6-metoxy-1,4-benzoquinol methylase